ncbi:MAG: hypothetical protein IPM64_16255 [Phycisphaerales bacterium]|nr:hypothetical protein [Phycisphaerales bacterium]
MTTSGDPRDLIRDENLRRIGATVQLPAPPDAARRARWRGATDSAATDSASSSTERAKGASHMRRNFGFAWIGSGLAAALAVFCWLALPVQRVSAQTVLAELHRAVAQGMTMTLRGIHLGFVRIDGRILIDQLGPAADAQTDALFSELNVRLLSDNPDWEDIDGLSVICQTPAAAWRYCRGNGGSASLSPVRLMDALIDAVGAKTLRKPRVTPTSYFTDQPRDNEPFWNLLGDFGAMPVALSFGDERGSVRYQFPLVQRQYVQALNTFLLQLASPKSSGMLLAALQQDCPDAAVEPSPAKGQWVLRVPNLARSRALKLLPRSVQLPDMEAFLRDYEITFTYDAKERRIVEMSWGSLPAEMTQAGIWPALNSLMDLPANAPEALKLPMESAEALLDHLHKHAASAAAEAIGGGRTLFRVKGLPLPFDTSASEWVAQLDEMNAQLELLVHYDADSKSVQRAELRNVAGPAGVIEIEIGNVVIDEALTNPQRYRDAAAANELPAPGDWEHAVGS